MEGHDEDDGDGSKALDVQSPGLRRGVLRCMSFRHNGKTMRHADPTPRRSPHAAAIRLGGEARAVRPGPKRAESAT